MTDFLIGLFLKDGDDVENKEVRNKCGGACGAVGIICNLLLCSVKIITGILSSSISIIADGLNNLSDMGSSVITMIGFKMAGKPADSDHPFGHGRMEYMSAFVVAMVIILVGFELLISSAKSLINGDAAPTYSISAIIVLLCSALLKVWMFVFNRKLSKKIGSEAIAATAQDSINDSVATGAILLSVLITKFFDIGFNLDAVMAAGVAVFIIYSGFSTAKQTLDSILGTPPDRELIKGIEETVMSFDDFIGVHDLIVHNYGPGRQFASIHVEVPQDIDIVKCHEHIDLCEKLVGEKYNISLVIHMDPIDSNNETVSAAKAAITEGIQLIDDNLSLHDFRMTPAGESRTNLIFDVVVPSSVKLSNSELNEKICKIARLINPTYCCVITFDNDFSGR